MHGTGCQTMVTDRELLARYVREGSEESFTELVRRHAGAVYACCLRVLGNRHDAEDAVQATFLLLTRKAPKVSGEVSLGGWLFWAASHCALTMKRSRARRGRHDREAAMERARDKARQQPGASGTFNESGTFVEDVKPHLDLALAGLPAAERDVTVLRFFYGRTEEEIGREVGCARRTVGLRLAKALERLRRSLSRRGLTLSAGALTACLGQCLAAEAPAGLAASVQAVCLGKAVASSAALSVTKGAVKAMMWTKLKIAAGLTASALALTAATVAVAAGLSAPVAAAETPGQWREIGKNGAVGCGAAVYAPTRKQVLRWGEFGDNRNAVHAFDAAKGQWAPDYEPDKARLSGTFYGGTTCGSWLAANSRPGPFFLFRQACWDSQRNRMVIVALDVMAAYDPAARKWTEIKSAFEDAKGNRKEAHGPAGYEKPWFAPVPGQWGSCAYDPINDEIVLFPLWACRATERTSGGVMQTGPDLLDDAGVLAGHYGTFVFDCKTNTWKLPELGGKEMLAARARLAGLINEQREACRKGWAALLELRQEKNAEAAKLMPAAAEAQKAMGAKLSVEKAELEKLAGELKGYEAGQVRDALKNLAATVARAGKAAAGLAAGKPEELPALCSQQRATYRELRLIRAEDLYVQPLPRCSTSIVYDSKNQCMVMAGGTHLDRHLNDTWVYDCKTRRWQRRAPVPEALEWPGVCYDSKRGVTLYAAPKGTYAYDAARDQWSRAGAGIPKYENWSFYCNMEYDESADLVVLNVGRKGDGEVCHVMRPLDGGPPVRAEPAPRAEVDDAAFPPPADPAVLERLKSLPANTWVLAKPNVEPTHRSWSRIDWDPTLRCAVYQGGGHAGTTNNTISAYFPETNKWVDAFKPQWPPSIFHNWGCCYVPSFERGTSLHVHARSYHSLDGRMVEGHQAGFEWSTRETPAAAGPVGGPVVDVARRRLIGFVKSHYRDTGTNHLEITDLATGKVERRKMEGPNPQTNISTMCVIPERNLLMALASSDGQKGPTVTWLLDLAKLDAWQKVEPKSPPPEAEFRGEGGMQLVFIPGTDYVVLAAKDGRDLWVYSLDRKDWRMLPTEDGGKRGARFDLYPQIVWDRHHGVIVFVVIRGGGAACETMLLRPDFGKIQW